MAAVAGLLLLRRCSTRCCSCSCCCSRSSCSCCSDDDGGGLGGGGGGGGFSRVEQRARSRRIDKLLEKDKQHLRRQVKLLLLGAGESGKSTFLKQMKIIHWSGSGSGSGTGPGSGSGGPGGPGCGSGPGECCFEEETVREFRTIIYQNVVKGTKVLCDARDKLGLEWQEAGNARLAAQVLKYENSMSVDTRVFADYVPLVRQLWKDAGIREAYERRREFQLADSVKYFLDNIDRIGMQEYVPSNQDILHARRATKGISELSIPIRGIPFLFVDVGGQRSQRRKWFQCFDCVTSILFLVSSSEYDQVLLEDRMTNRLIESKNIFETIVNNRCFSDVSVILFLNKTDLLKQKLRRKDSDVQRHLARYAGDPHDVDAVQRHMVEMFDEVRRDKRKPFFYHFTTAVDTENIKVVFNAVRDSILTKNLKQLMLQ